MWTSDFLVSDGYSSSSDPIGGNGAKKKRSFALSRRWQTTQRPKDLQQNGTNKQNALLQQFIMWKWKLKWQQQMEQGASNKTNYIQTNRDNPRKTHFFTRRSSSFFLLTPPGCVFKFMERKTNTVRFYVQHYLFIFRKKNKKIYSIQTGRRREKTLTF